MPPTELGYEFRPDGAFLIRKNCGQCGEPFDVHALQNATSRYALFCPACIQVADWEREFEDGRHAAD